MLVDTKIKCSLSIRDKLITESVSECSFLKLNEIGNIQLRRGRKYYAQFFSQTALTKAQLCHFVVW